jgi:hypothetical protein
MAAQRQRIGKRCLPAGDRCTREHSSAPASLLTSPSSPERSPRRKCPTRVWPSVHAARRARTVLLQGRDRWASNAGRSKALVSDGSSRAPARRLHQSRRPRGCFARQPVARLDSSTSVGRPRQRAYVGIASIRRYRPELSLIVRFAGQVNDHAHYWSPTRSRRRTVCLATSATLAKCGPTPAFVFADVFLLAAAERRGRERHRPVRQC